MDWELVFLASGYTVGFIVLFILSVAGILGWWTVKSA